uniref:23S rRNA accumulation protein YceD n=1 Tax=Candidatus Kentrum eta TaxID=2126337 RepID=A0A450VKG6_9GAMM|nr:MAG: hypothetical protein BECKH772B_GA0070898_105671 [Candidatus Kentron sp. H]VFK08199.1 MAG: hypothetical protein BECKH772C_GA0070978_104951 [Candidatus Kentron sp. H]
MLQDLPELIYPRQLVRAKRSLCGRVTLARMPRLQPLLAGILAEGDTHDARVDLRFALDDSGRPSIWGTVQADLNLICQRCLKAVPFRAEGEVHLGIISMNDQMDYPGQPNESIFILTNLANGGVFGVQQSPF